MKIYKFFRQRLQNFPFTKRVCKFLIIGGFSAVINFLVYLSLTEFLDLWYVFSAVLSFVVAAGFNFSFNKYWTFRNRSGGREAYGQAAKFLVVYISGLAINTLFIYALTEFWGIDYRLSWVIATGLVTFWNFGLSHFWTFGRSV